MSGLASIFDPANAEKFKRVEGPAVAPRPKKPKVSVVADEIDSSDAMVNPKKRVFSDISTGESEKKKKPKHEKRKLAAISKKINAEGEDALDAVEKSFIATSRRQRPVSEPEVESGPDMTNTAEDISDENKEKNERTLFAGVRCVRVVPAKLCCTIFLLGFCFCRISQYHIQLSNSRLTSKSLEQSSLCVCAQYPMKEQRLTRTGTKISCARWP